MRKPRHNKLRNTGLLFEFLLRQITVDVLNKDDNSKAISIIKKSYCDGRKYDSPNSGISEAIFAYTSNIKLGGKSKYNNEYMVSGESFLTKINNVTYMIRDIIKKNTKITPKLSTTGGTSDARFIRKISPCIEFGLVGKTMHKVDEAVSLKDLKKLTKIYKEILDNYFK